MSDDITPQCSQLTQEVRYSEEICRWNSIQVSIVLVYLGGGGGGGGEVFMQHIQMHTHTYSTCMHTCAYTHMHVHTGVSPLAYIIPWPCLQG